MVGPSTREWKVLRETDGERFVVLKKGDNFQGEFANTKTEVEVKLMFEECSYVIRYPLATELFANKKVGSAMRSNANSHDEWDGPRTIDLGVAKTFSITIMRLPRWKRCDCSK
jgi:hypothetical protein